MALENAYRKAAAIAPADLPVLGVDTVVSLGWAGPLFGKPRDAEPTPPRCSARSPAARHVVVSGVCLIDA